MESNRVLLIQYNFNPSYLRSLSCTKPAQTPQMSVQWGDSENNFTYFGNTFHTENKAGRIQNLEMVHILSELFEASVVAHMADCKYVTLKYALQASSYRELSPDTFLLPYWCKIPGYFCLKSLILVHRNSPGICEVEPPWIWFGHPAKPIN